MNSPSKTSQSVEKDNKDCRDASNPESMLLTVVTPEQPPSYSLLSNLHINQEEALRGVSLEALSHIMQSCHPSSSQYGLLPHSAPSSYTGTLHTYNNSQDKAMSGAEDLRNSSDHMCVVCKLTLPSAADLTTHRQTVHADRSKSELPESHREFSRNCGIQDKDYGHGLSVPEQSKAETFSCDTCSAAFNTSFDLKAHSAKHSRTHGMSQDEALRAVSMEALSHMMQSCQPASSQYVIPHPPPPYLGTLQPYNTQEKTGASAEDRKSGDHSCSVCKLSLSSAADLDSHRQTVHAEILKSELSKTHEEFSRNCAGQSKDYEHGLNISDQPKAEFPCNICGSAFNTSFELKAHSTKHTGFSQNVNHVEAMRQVNLETLNHIMQTSCNPPTSSHFSLMNASYGHPSSSFQTNVPTFNSSQEKTQDAPVAEAVYSDEEERSSTNDIGVMCSVCKMSFVNASQLLSHRRSVHRGQISCEFCGKNFANTHNLKIHSFSHTGDNRLKSFCESCGKGFIKPSDLKRHEIIHAGRYSCLECNINFSTADEVKEHSKAHEEFSSNCNDCKKELINKRALTNSQEQKEQEVFTCDTCGLNLDNKYDLKAHLLKHAGTGSSQNVCETCGKTFSRPSDLNRHTVVHTGQRPFTCSECNMSFGNQSNLRMHVLTHTDVKPHPCTVCEKSFRRSADLERHSCTHSGERPFACDLCSMGFTTSYNLKIHQLKHTGDLPYPCSICEKAFSKPSELQRHNLIHTGERPFCCPQCGMNFSNSSNLRNHMITHSGRRPYPCSICKKAFTRPSDVKRHVLTHTGARPFACHICGLAFADSSNLKKHTLTHSRFTSHNKLPVTSIHCQICDTVCNSSAELDSHVRDNHGDGNKEFLTKLNINKQYTCAICGLRFAHAIHLQEHSLIHDREHSFQCEICDKSFAQELFLQRHLLTHTEARPYECPECFKCFKSSSHLKNHIPIHSGVKPFVCVTCNKAFLKNASLRRHQTIHARGNTVACHVCGKSFLNMEYLKKHSIIHES